MLGDRQRKIKKKLKRKKTKQNKTISETQKKSKTNCLDQRKKIVDPKIKEILKLKMTLVLCIHEFIALRGSF